MELEKKLTEKMFRFYLGSSQKYRFPFFDPENPYRKSGMFVGIENSVLEAGDRLRKQYGENFVSINMRGSWLRGIPIKEDDIDLLFIVRNLPKNEEKFILKTCRSILKKENPNYKVCHPKMEGGIKVEHISFLDLAEVDLIFNKFLYGLKRFIQPTKNSKRDSYQDSYFGSKQREKLVLFLKSGILIPYVGWIFGKDRKREVFDALERFLPIPTKPLKIYSEQEIDFAKEVIRQIFIARNLVYPSIRRKEFYQDSDFDPSKAMDEALKLYWTLEPLEVVHARALLNYVYTVRVEQFLLGKSQIKGRVEKFAATYDRLVDYILQST